MLRKLLIVAIACFVVIAAPSAMYTVQAQLAVSANHQFSIAAAATKAPTATSKSKTPLLPASQVRGAISTTRRVPPRSATMAPTITEPAITARARITRVSRSG